MIRVAWQRLVALVPTMVIVLLVSFLLVEMIPGDAAETLAGEGATPEMIARLRERLGLGDSIVSRIVDYFGDVVRGDLGTSLMTARPVSTSLTKALPVTASITLVALSIALVVGVAGGLVSALYRDRAVDRVIGGASAVALAAPPFVVALALVVPLAVNRSVFPATGYAGLNHGIWEWLRHLILPSIALSLAPAAELVRQVRSALVDTFSQDFIFTSEANGLSRRSVIGKHSFKNAAPPILTVFGLQLARVLGGAAIVEVVFAMPGLGNLALTAVLQRDVFLIQGIVLVSALVVIATNLLVDLADAALNPKLRDEGA